MEDHSCLTDHVVRSACLLPFPVGLRFCEPPCEAAIPSSLVLEHIRT